MQFQQLYSGSQSNLYVLTANNGKRLLIEAGARWADLQKALKYNLRDFEGCLISHEHMDHSRSICEVRRSGIPVYANIETLQRAGISGRNINILTNDKVDLENFTICPFDLNHDAPIKGFVVWADGEPMLFATDTSHITQDFRKIPFSIIAIECSYNGAVLRKKEDEGKINSELAKRLLTSHMEIENCMSYMTNFCNLEKCREIHLLHMSGDNINKEKTRQRFEDELFTKTIVI